MMTICFQVETDEPEDSKESEPGDTTGPDETSDTETIPADKVGI